MASNQSRLFSSIIKLSTSKLGLLFTKSESASLSGLNSARQLICSSTQHQLQDQVNPNKLGGEESEIKDKIESKKDDEDKDEDNDFDLNKETGEIGGPRGPEPTRYDDWERNGRCSDF